jgi:hypothetical protein
MRGEADLVCRWEAIRSEEGNLGGVITRLERSAHRHGTIQNDDAVLSRIVEVAVHTKQRSERDDQACFLSNFAPRRLFDIFAILDEATRDIPMTLPGLEFAARQQNRAVLLNNAATRGRGVPVVDLAAASADAANVTIQLAFDGGSAASRAEPDRGYHSTRHVSVWRTPTAPAIPEVIQFPNDWISGLSTYAIRSKRPVTA